MANANAVKIRSTKKNANGKPKYPKPSGANLAHNSAVNKATYWLNDGNKIIQSQSYNNTHEVNADWIKWENEARERYLQNEKNQRAIKSNAVLLEEGLIIIGTDVNAKEKDIEKIVKDFVAKFEKDNNTKVRHWAYHNHEGHEEDGKEHINRHVHFIFDNVDNNGTMVRRNWKRDYFRQMQTDIFDISKKYIKNIERAKESEYEEVEIEDRIVKVNTRKQIHHRVFRNMKENEQIADLKEEKTILKKENSSLKGQVTRNKNEKEKLKEELQKLKDESKDLRAELQLQKAEKEAYQQLDYLNKQLQEQLKIGRKSFEEAKKEIEDLREKLIKKEEDFKEIEDLKKEKEHLKSVIEVKEIDILELKNAQITLKDELKEVSSQCEVLNFDKKELKEANKALQKQKMVLEGKVTTLEQKTAPEPNIVPQKEIIDELQNIIKEEFVKKEILESRMGKATPAIIVKDSDSFLKKIQKLTSQGVANSVNSLKKEINEWKEKYNNLIEVLKSKDQKIADLENKLQTISTKQIEKENLNILKSLQSEAKRDGLDTSESEALFNKNQEEKTEEISSKKRDFGRSR